MMKNTTAKVQDDRLNIMAPNARTASVMSLEMDKVKDGSFIVNETKDGASALEFKPSDRKTGDTIAIYNNSSEAAKALEAVFKAIGNNKSGKQGVIGFILYIIKILLLTFLALLVLGIILFFVLGNAVKDAVTDGGNVSAVITRDNIQTPELLPIGEPILVDDYVETLEN